MFSHIFELRIERIVNHEALVNRELTSHSNKIRHSLVQVAELRYLGVLQDQLLQIVEFGAETKVLVSKSLGGLLNGFASVRDLVIDPLIVGVENIEIVAELLGHVRSFT